MTIPSPGGVLFLVYKAVCVVLIGAFVLVNLKVFGAVGLVDKADRKVVDLRHRRPGN